MSLFNDSFHYLFRILPVKFPVPTDIHNSGKENLTLSRPGGGAGGGMGGMGGGYGGGMDME